MKKLLLIDNYDSFTYNLVQYFQELGVEVIVRRNDEISVLEATDLKPDYLVFSPGPGTVENPSDIGIGVQLLENFRGKVPILGVCLGHQMIGKYFGGTIQKVSPAHGKRYPIQIADDSVLFSGLPKNIEVMRYHSLVVDKMWKKNTAGFQITAVTDDEEALIMACENSAEKIYGVQFHPESVGTPAGKQMLGNFLRVSFATATG